MPRHLRPRSRLLGAALADPAGAPELVGEIRYALQRARTLPAAALLLGVATRTLAGWLARYPELRAAMEAGRAAHGLDRRGYRSCSREKSPLQPCNADSGVESRS